MSDWLCKQIELAKKRAKDISPERRQLILDKYKPGPRPPRGYGHNWALPNE